MDFPETIFLYQIEDDLSSHWLPMKLYRKNPCYKRIYRRIDSPLGITPEQRDAIVAGMTALLRELSRKCYDCDWKQNVEFFTYNESLRDEHAPWRVPLWADVGKKFMTLAEIIGHAIHKPDKYSDPVLLPIDEWLKLFEEWREKIWPRGKQDNQMAYVVFSPCGCLAYAGIISPETADENAKALEKYAKLGLEINTVSSDTIRNISWKCDEHNLKEVEQS